MAWGWGHFGLSSGNAPTPVNDLALRFKAANARPLASPRIHHHDRPFPSIGDDPRREDDTRQKVVDGPVQRATIDQHVMVNLSTVAIGLDVISISSLPRRRNRSRDRRLRWTASIMYSGKAAISLSGAANRFGKLDNSRPTGLAADAAFDFSSSVIFIDLSLLD
jgi:hypothetical protein